MSERGGVTLKRAAEMIGGDKPLSTRTISAMITRGDLEAYGDRKGRHTAAALYTGLSAPDIVRAAIAGHSPKTITDYYGEPDVETLRPWVEKVYQQLTGEVEKMRATGT